MQGAPRARSHQWTSVEFCIGHCPKERHHHLFLKCPFFKTQLASHVYPDMMLPIQSANPTHPYHFIVYSKQYSLGMWSLRREMIECQPVEMWWWQRRDVRVGAGRLGENVWRMIWMSWVYTLNGCSGICGEASYRGKRLTLAERGRNERF